MRVMKHGAGGCAAEGLSGEPARSGFGVRAAAGSRIKGVIRGNAELGFGTGGVVGSRVKGLIELNRIENEVRSLVR